MKKYTLKDNVISALIGVVIGLPLALYSVHSQSERKVLTVKPSYEVVNTTVVQEASTEAKSEPTKTYDSIDLIALCTEAEASNQDLEGKRLVVDVILNRVDDPDFPNTAREVITQPHQFETWTNGAIDRVKLSESTIEAVNLELASLLITRFYILRLADMVSTVLIGEK